MLFDAIDQVTVTVPDLTAAAAAFRRLGLTVSPERSDAGHGLPDAGFAIGGERNRFLLRLLSVESRDGALADSDQRGAVGPTLALRTSDIGAAVSELRRRGAPYSDPEPVMAGDRKVADRAEAPRSDVVGVQPALVQHSESGNMPYGRVREAGLTPHALPLKRLDHLAAVALDLAAQSAYWSDVLGVPLFGEIRTPVMIIRQFKIGDAILELLGPATPESPIAQRPPGLVSMIACEVDNLPAAVEMARAAGFSPSEPGPGALPGTRTATIPPAELSGLALQLLQYV